MKIYSTVKRPIFVLLFVTMFYCTMQSKDQPQVSDELDLMVDFAYPVSMMQSIRQDLSQALYYFQHNNDFESVATILQNAFSKLTSRQFIQQDDREFIQEMINKINELIDSLESSEHRSMMSDLCEQIQSQLSH